MRPPEFTGGNKQRTYAERLARRAATSMRPPEFTGGNELARHVVAQLKHAQRFNEAAGIHRRKQRCEIYGTGWSVVAHPASMRPPEFTGGNLQRNLQSGLRFNPIGLQ